ncbi:serine hydrolase [Rhizorhapis sp. SPR117]|uniref:serine hydrolase n=1 Tax=Rhizorhapis sp. SPR117 TaxID=2912611 RepID=UPI001F1A49D5|nr:class A beta-lactamase-related serine hydrolase [Rhizorhapis sp. SPR117]
MAIITATATLFACSAAIIPEGPPQPAVASRVPVNPPQRIPDYNPRNKPSPALVKIIHDLGRNFDGHVGIAVQRVDADWVVDYNGTSLFPQQSVSKLWVAMTVLDAVDRGKLSLNSPTVVQKQDLTLFHQPLAAMVNRDGYKTTLSDLFTRAMQQSDNTANDKLLRTVGGPDAIRAFLGKNFIANIRFGPGERLLQSTTAGLDWNPNYSLGRNFYTARANLPRSVRERALDKYLANPPDGAAPVAIVGALAKLKRGDLLSPSSTQLLLSTMERARTGPQRIKGGVPHGWTYAHKTGTGQDLAPRSTGYNDIGIMTAPDGTSYAVAVMIGSTTVPIPKRWELMQAVSRAVAANHDRN